MIRPGAGLDASMDLLHTVRRFSVDPDYAVVAARGRPPAGRRWALAAVAVLAGAMFAVAALETSRTAPALEIERGELIDRLQAAEVAQDEVRAELARLSGDLDRLRTTASGGDATVRSLEREIDELDPVVGAAAVRGPGVVIVADDAPRETEDARDRVLDLDLQVMANGLWQAGAEAVAVNGHRLSALTAIRGAGDAITVDYRSLSRPYRIEAIGDPRTLQARWVESAGGAWWQALKSTRQMRYDVAGSDALTLAADPGLRLRHARRAAQ